MKILVIGYGNHLRRDDGLGWLVARTLQDEVDRDNVEILAEFQLFPEMAYTISHADLVVFVDASLGEVPGTITRVDIGVDSDFPASDAFLHNFNPAHLLLAAQKLYQKEPRAILFTVTGANFDFGEVLSEPVQAALPALLSELRAILSR